MKGFWIPVALAAALVAAPGSARAQEEEAEETPHASSAAAMEGAQERARLHFQSGASYYEAGSYEDALREFQHAYELSGRPQLLYNLSLCYQQLGQLEAAITHLRRYLSEVEDIPNRANLELRAQNLQRRIDEQQAEASAAEATAEPESAPSAAAETTAPPAEPAGDEPNVGAIVGFSIAAVGVVMAGVFGALTIVEDGQLADTCSPSCSAEAISTLQTYALVTDIGFGVALAGAAVGTLLLLIDGGGGEPEQARLHPWLNESSGGLAVRGAF